MIKLGKKALPSKFRGKKTARLGLIVLVLLGAGIWGVWHRNNVREAATKVTNQTSKIPIIADNTKDMFAQPTNQKDGKEANLKILNDFKDKIAAAPNQPIAVYANAIVIAQALQPESVKMLAEKALANASDLGSSDKITKAYIEFVRKAGGQ